MNERKEAAKVILDSISPSGSRLTTIECTLIRWTLAELNTHRAFSRNSASSRAIPVEKQLQRVKENPAWPIFWASEQPGMQGGGELTGQPLIDAIELFHDIEGYTTRRVQNYLMRYPDKSERLHKSLLNRLLEPFMWHTVIISSTEAGWQNFFQLRSTAFTDLAQPEIAVVADMIYEQYNLSIPQRVELGEWHTPYIQPDDDFSQFEDKAEAKKQVSVGRSARVSYLTHDGNRDLGEDVNLYAKLTDQTPRHDSPLEHVATPAPEGVSTLGNFDGWEQLRHYAA